MTAEKAALLDELCSQLRAVPNISAIVLGGSYATGLNRESSDLDIGIYYHPDTPFSIDAIRAIAHRFQIPELPLVVTDFYGWGQWVNGGAWLHTPNGKVDFIYRNLRQVETVLAEGSQGFWSVDYDQQPPFGFRSLVYFAETSVGIPMYDPEGLVARLKESVKTYPEPLRNRVINESLWQGEFGLFFCRDYVARTDIVNATACMSRVGHFLIHALFALNYEYFINDKHTDRIMAKFAFSPNRFTERLGAVLGNVGLNVERLEESLRQMHLLWQDTVTLTNGGYQSRFAL